MRGRALVTVALAVSALTGCGDQAGSGVAAEPSGITGRVHLGPQCPVETQDDPCPEQPPDGSKVTVAEQGSGDSSAAGKVVARTTTDAEGNFRVAVAPGSYVVTAEAGMSCELVDVRVDAGAFSKVDVPCDTGIR
jgi:hypothetical protein